MIVQGVSVNAVDDVVLWDQNHPSNSAAWDVRAKRDGFRVRRFSIPTTAGSIDEVVDLFVDAVGDRTKVISFTHISNTTGFRVPVAEVCAAIRAKKDASTRCYLFPDNEETLNTFRRLHQGNTHQIVF